MQITPGGQVHPGSGLGGKDPFTCCIRSIVSIKLIRFLTPSADVPSCHKIKLVDFWPLYGSTNPYDKPCCLQSGQAFVSNILILDILLFWNASFKSFISVS